MMRRPILIACLLLAAWGAAAQERSVNTFGEWSLRCEAGPPRNCEVATTLANPEGRPTAQIVLGRLNSQGPLLAMAHLPLNVFLPGQARIIMEGEPMVLAFQRCVPQGCFAMLEVDDAVLRRLRAEPGGARLVFQDATRRDVTLALSLRGFARAQTALATQR